MKKYYYIKKTYKPYKKWLRVISLLIFFVGSAISTYIFLPFWQIYFSSPITPEEITAPIPQGSIAAVDYTDASSWFPEFEAPSAMKPIISLYTLSIPKINIKNAKVSTENTDLAKNLVNYPGTGIPGEIGNAVIFGHSTLPYFYNANDYKTMFTNIFRLKTGDKIYISLDNKTYSYKIYGIDIVSPSDTTIFYQNFDNSYLTLVTCTPPGTIWKRLIVKAKLENLSADRQEKEAYARL